MIKQILVFLAVFPAIATGETLKEYELFGTWVPSGEMPRSNGLAEYNLLVNTDLSATYISPEKGYKLQCAYKPSESQRSVFVWYCLMNQEHLITLSLGGWSGESGKLLYGYEYWLGYPKPGEIHGGLPVSLKLNSL